MSDETIFVKTLLKKNFPKHKIFDCRNLTFIDDKIDRKYFEKNQAVFFKSVNINISIEYFYPYATIPNGAKIIIEYTGELKDISLETSFNRRFNVINSNTISYKELMSYLNEQQ